MGNTKFKTYNVTMPDWMIKEMIGENVINFSDRVRELITKGYLAEVRQAQTNKSLYVYRFIKWLKSLLVSKPKYWQELGGF